MVLEYIASQRGNLLISRGGYQCIVHYESDTVGYPRCQNCSCSGMEKFSVGSVTAIVVCPSCPCPVSQYHSLVARRATEILHTVSEIYSTDIKSLPTQAQLYTSRSDSTIRNRAVQKHSHLEREDNPLTYTPKPHSVGRTVDTNK